MATARTLTFSEDDLAENTGGGGGGAYAAIEVPGDYEMILRVVEDYDKREQKKSHGWVFTYGVDGGGGEADFKVWLSFGSNANWKMAEVMQAHGIEFDPGVGLDLDPDSLIGDVVGGHIDFPRDKVTNEPTSSYREIRQVFALVDAPAPVEDTGSEAPTL